MIRASLNHSARVDKNSIYYCEYYSSVYIYIYGNSIICSTVVVPTQVDKNAR